MEIRTDTQISLDNGTERIKEHTKKVSPHITLVIT
jgi:hypothetical protein